MSDESSSTVDQLALSFIDRLFRRSSKPTRVETTLLHPPVSDYVQTQCQTPRTRRSSWHSTPETRRNHQGEEGAHDSMIAKPSHDEPGSWKGFRPHWTSRHPGEPMPSVTPILTTHKGLPSQVVHIIRSLPFATPVINVLPCLARISHRPLRPAPCLSNNSPRASISLTVSAAPN